MKRSITTTSGRLTIITGSEGPCWDLYSYTETILAMPNGVTIICHMGLGESVTVNGHTITEYSGGADELFEQLTGFYPQEVEKWIHKARSRCKKCGCRKGDWCDGYEGEQIKICSKCNEWMDYMFDEMAIR